MRVLTKTALLSGIASSLFFTGAAAAEAPQYATGDASIIVIGTRVDLLKIPGSGTRLEAEDLARSQVFTVNEALRSVPGVFPRDEEGVGLRPNIGLRGLSPTRSSKVLLLEDGLPLGFAPYGDNASYYHPPVERFAAIEVLKGASQIRFGPQTIAGVVNYITPDAPPEPMGRITLAGGNEGYRKVDAMAGGPALLGRLLGHASYKTSEGSRENLDLQYLDVFIKGEWNIGENHDITLRLNRFEEDSQVTYSGLTLAEFIANPRQNPFKNDEFVSERTGISATHGWAIAENFRLLTSAYWTYFDRDWWRQSSNSGQRPNDASDPLCGGMANLDTTCGNEGRLREYETIGLETRLSIDHAAFGWTGASEIGLRYHVEEQDRLQVNGDSPRARVAGISVNAGLREDNERSVDAFSAHAVTEIEIGRLVLAPGVRAEWIDFERVNNLNGTRGSSSVEEIVPGIGANLRLTDEVALYAGVHKGFAPPRVEDIINTTGGSIDLEAEKSVNYEIGIRGSLAGGLTLDAALFRLDFENQIIPQSVAGGVGSTLTSAGETRHEGTELSLAFSARDAGFLSRDDFYLALNTSYLWDAAFEGARFSSVSGFAGVSVSGNRLPYAPEWLLSFKAGYDFGEIATLEGELVFTDEMFTDDLNTIAVISNGQRGLIESATVANFTFSFTPPETGWTFFATVKNAFDELYVADRSRGVLPGTPRLIQAGVTLSL